MRATRIALIAVVAAAVGLCTLSLVSVRGIVGEMDDLRVTAQELARQGDNMGAMERLVEIANRWEQAAPTLEILTSHDDLHEVNKELVDAQVCLENGDLDDCYRALAQLGEVFEHIRAMEAVTLSNLY